MKHVKQKRLEEHRIGAHRLEVEHLQVLDGQRVVEVVEEGGVPSLPNPFVETRRQCSWQQVRNREQSTLVPVENEKLFDGFVHFAILEIAQPITVVPLQQNAHERVEK